MATVGLQTCDVIDCLPRKVAQAGAARQECVLLIEDSEEAMLLVRYALQEYGNGTYRLEWANGLTAGLRRLAREGVDLVLLDLGLPESSGPASYETIRRAAPDLPILVLTGDTREETALRITSEGVEDFLVKDEVSGSLLLQAIRTALYSNRRWREQKNAGYKTNPRFVWALESTRALGSLAMRTLQASRIESTIACVKALCAIVENYSQAEGAALTGRADLFVPLERLARAAVARGHNESARRFRAMIAPPASADLHGRAEFAAALELRFEDLDREPEPNNATVPDPKSTDLERVLREILQSVPSLK